MFQVRGPAAIATIQDLKARLKATLDTAQEMPVYVTRGGEPVAGIVSMEMMEILQEAPEDRYIGHVAGERLQAIRSGEEELLDEKDFWVQADAAMTARR